MMNLRKHISFLVLLLIPVYLLVLVSTIRNKHSHVLPNGLVITHSHPFTDANGQPVKHGHTPNQILFYQLFTFDFFQSAPELIVSAEEQPIQEEVKIVYTEIFLTRTFSTTFLRGPPIV